MYCKIAFWREDSGKLIVSFKYSFSRANGGHPNVKVVAEGAMTGEMMEDNAGRKKRSTQKIFTRDLAWSRMVLKKTIKSLQVMGEQDSNLEEKVVEETMARLSRNLPSLHLTGTRYLQLNLPSTRQVGTTWNTWLAT